MATGYVIRYATRRSFRAEHDAYLSHGGMVVAHPAAPPPANALTTVRVEIPGGLGFTLSCRVGQPVPGQGFMVTFEPSAKAARAALQQLLASPEFLRAEAAEGASVERPAVSSLDEADGEDVLTDPGLESLQLDFDAPAAPKARAPAKARPAAGQDQTEIFDPETSFDSLDLEIPDDERADPDDDGLALHPDIMRGRFAAAPRAPISEAERHRAPEGGTVLRRPEPGETYQVYVVKYTTVTDYVPVADDLEKNARMHVPYADNDSRVNDTAVLRLTLPGHNVFNVWAVIESISYDEVELRVDPHDEALRKAIVYKDTIGARARLEAEKEQPPGEVSVIRLTEVVPEEREEDMPIRRRLQRMGMDDKINLAQAGNKEERMALAMDPNKAVHHYLLKNAKITLDEIAFMARLPSLNPDVLDKIAENPAYTQNPTVAKALVYNPKTPVRTAIRLLDRLPRSEVMNLSKRMGMNLKLVMAAKKRLETFKG